MHIAKRELQHMQEMANDEEEAKRQKVMSESAYLIQTWSRKYTVLRAKIRDLEATLLQKEIETLRLKAVSGIRVGH